MVCMTGMVGGEWELQNFSPMEAISTTVGLTTYAGESDDFVNTPLQSVIRDVELGTITPTIGRVFQLDQIVEAHCCMEDNAAGGKIVVLTSKI
jgi:NADPH:quinone reductase-like Zn-dependent oxidoreductase